MVTTCESNYAACPIFRTLAPEERDIVLQVAEFEIHERGYTILRQGNEKPSGLWMIRSGACEVVSDVYQGAEQQMALLSDGAIFGEISFFDPGLHSATVRVVEPAEVMHLSLESFERLSLSHPGIAFKLLRNLGRVISQKLRRMDQVTLDLFAYPA